MDCRNHCGACCIAPSIAEPFYGMPAGKPAGVPCVHLDDDMRCMIFADARRPEFSRKRMTPVIRSYPDTYTSH